MKKYIENNGYIVKAEVMGYSDRRRRWIPVLKFKDNMGIEHVVEAASTLLMKYNKGDILNINYIEFEKLPDDLKKFEFGKKKRENVEVQVTDKYFTLHYTKVLLKDNSKYKIIIKDKPTRISYYLIPILFSIIIILSAFFKIIMDMN